MFERDERKVRIEKIVNGGYGLCRIDGRAALVSFSAPGDLLTVKPVKSDEGSSLFYEIKTILEPSPLREHPRCTAFGVCGGCDFDHLGYASELGIKRGILLEDLERIAGQRVEQLIEVIPCPEEYGYRNNALIRVDARGKVGFFRKKSHEVISFPPAGCLLLDYCLSDFVVNIVKAGGLREGGVRVRSNGDGQVFCRGAAGREDDTYASYRVGDLQFRIGIDDFFQVNRYLNETWVRLMEKHLKPEPGDRFYDLFCGSGLIALSLSRAAGAVTGIEANGSAVRNGRFNASQNRISNATFVAADLTKRIDLARWEPEGGGALKIIADPPRTGLTEHLIDAIVQLEPAAIVYASCNSATFARDVGRLVRKGYGLKGLSLIDMFPRTHHIETVARFLKYA